MKLISLQSGSNGNCIYIESEGARLLFDAGISGKKAEARLKAHQVDIRDVNGLIISHDHADHIGSVGIFHRKFGLPIYATRPTFEHASRRRDLGAITALNHFVSGQTLKIGDLIVETVKTPHDGVDGVAFVITNGHRRLGILTDLGHVTESLDTLIGTLDAVFIESNYDIKMLDLGRYPLGIKQRIKGPGGHLSNLETARLIRNHSHHLGWACLGHLSENNNTPQKAFQTCTELVGTEFPLHLAGRHGASEVLTV